mgnify:FL=1
MSEERLFQVNESGATPVPSTRLSQMGFKEHKDLEAWVIEHPQILGEDILIVTDQFDRWEAATGERPLDRLDVLGLGSDGRLVLAELKRDRAPRGAHLQAITYAALVARLAPHDVVKELQRHLQRQAEQADRRPGEPAETWTADDARELVEAHCGGPLDEEILRSPRIVLVAGGFSPVTLTAVDWQASQGLDVTLQQVQAYALPSGEKIVTVSKLFPLASTEDFLVTPAAAKVEKKREQKDKNTAFRIIEEGLLEDGTELAFKIATRNQEYRELITGWLEKHPAAVSQLDRTCQDGPLSGATTMRGTSRQQLLRRSSRRPSVRDPFPWLDLSGG